jgi:hypothetical protein
MKNVLIVAPHFPPSGMPPSHRARQFATHLPEYGWRPTIITVRPEFLQETHEPALCSLVPDDVEVIHTGAIPAKRPGQFGLGDLGIRTLWGQAPLICDVCRDRKIDLVYLPCPPNHQLLLGRLIHARLGIPYVVDYIDPWQSDWLEEHARPFTKLWIVHHIATVLEPLVLAKAGGITAVSQGTIDGVTRRYGARAAEMTAAVPYGAEPDLYDRLRASRQSTTGGDGTRRLLYLGAMWEAAYGTLRAFFDALRLVKEQTPDLYRKCRVDFIGTTYAPTGALSYQVLPIAEAAGVADVVTETPARLPFLDALNSLATSDTLLMIGSSETHYTPSRLLPYVFARRPIFALMNAASDATGLLRRHTGVQLVAYDSERPAASRVAEIHRELVAWLQGIRAPDLPPVDASWDAYTARTLTGHVAALFDRVVAAKAGASTEAALAGAARSATV